MSEEKKWGGKRSGAGRKPKDYVKLSTPLPNGDEFFFEPSQRTSAYSGGQNHHYVLAYRQLREAVEALYKQGKVLKAPKDMDDDAKDVWNRLMACYASQEGDILSTLDTTMLRLFCESNARYLKAMRCWSTTLEGRIVANSEKAQRFIDECMKTMRKETELMKSLATDLGLTITGRAKMGILAMKVQKKKDDDAQSQLADLFGGM